MPIAFEKPEPRIVNVHEAKTNLSKIIEAVENGENIILARNGKPAVQITQLEKPVSKGWSREMLEFFAQASANPVSEIEPDFLVRTPYDLKMDRNPMAWLEDEHPNP